MRLLLNGMMLLIALLFGMNAVFQFSERTSTLMSFIYCAAILLMLLLQVGLLMLEKHLRVDASSRSNTDRKETGDIDAR